MNFPYRAEPTYDVPLYGHGNEKLGTLHQNMVTGAGERCYGVLAFNCGDGHVAQIPVPWAIINFDRCTGRYFAYVDRLKLLEAPRFKTSDIAGFDADFASEVDAAYGLEFPGIESMNDLA
jgi:hypothetical protein